MRYSADGVATIAWLQTDYGSQACFQESEGSGSCEVDEYVKVRQVAADGSLSAIRDVYHRHTVYPTDGTFGGGSSAYVAYGPLSFGGGQEGAITVLWGEAAFGEGCAAYGSSYSYADEGCEADESIRWARISSAGIPEGAPQIAYAGHTSGYGAGRPLLRMKVGTASDGTAAVLFGVRSTDAESQCWGGESTVGTFQIGADGGSTAPQLLDSGCGSVDPQLVVEADGTATAAWSWGGSYSGSESRYVRIDSAGQPGDPAPLLPEGESGVAGLDLGRGSGGAPTAVWSTGGVIRTRQIPPVGEPGPITDLVAPGEDRYLENPRIAQAADGSGAVIWEDSPSGSPYLVGLQGVELAADGTAGTVRTLLSVSGRDHGVRISAGGEGELMASWRVSVPHANKLQSVRVSSEVPSGNDDFGAAEALDPTLPAFAGGSNEGASKQAEEPAHAGNAGGASVWYSWTASASGPVAISTCASGSLDPLLAVYEGSSLGSLSEVASADSGAAAPCSGSDAEVRFDAVAGTTYEIAVDGKNASEGSFGLKVAVRERVPSNDDFSSPKPLGGVSGQRSGTNVEASKQTGEPDHAGNAGGASVWYSWTATNDGAVVFSVCGYSLQTPLLAVYTGGSVGALTEVGADTRSANAIACSGSGSEVRFQAEAGTTYRIAIDGRDGHEGRFRLDHFQVPPNDDFAAPQEISTSSGFTYGSNYAATREPGEPEIGGDPGGASVWYSWTPSSSGTAVVSACMFGSRS
ncbi:MAG: hypothetical protein ACM3Q9_01905, partial [Methanosarcina sp.]